MAAAKYDGPERRAHTECAMHQTVEKNLEKLTTEASGKVSLKLFYTVILLIVIVLGVQWRTYVEIGALRLTFADSIHSISLQTLTYQQGAISEQMSSERAIGLVQRQFAIDIEKLEAAIKEYHPYHED